jgi:non-ribosomal peptide synthetase component F
MTDSPSQPKEPVDHFLTELTRPFIPFLKEETEQSIPQRFEEQVTRYPERIAVKGQKHSLTYDALNRWANRVARSILARRAEGEEITVGLLLEKDAPAMAALMGALKAGLVYVPIDLSHPAARASKMLDDARASLVLTDDVSTAIAQLLENDSRRLLNIDRLNPKVSDQNVGLPLSRHIGLHHLYFRVDG